MCQRNKDLKEICHSLAAEEGERGRNRDGGKAKDGERERNRGGGKAKDGEREEGR